MNNAHDERATYRSQDRPLQMRRVRGREEMGVAGYQTLGFNMFES
jgi:hypothetical protein